MVIESRPICPFIGKECIACGVSQDWLRTKVLHPCAFFDEYASSDVEPCKIKRAINRILKEPDYPDRENKVDVPY